jgi:type I restriction enzyme R subunit
MANMAGTMRPSWRKVIIDEQPINPRYYETMSDLLDTLIQERKAQALEYEAYLARVVALTRQVQNPTGGTAYPQALDTRAKRALYDNLGKDEQLAVDIDYEIRSTKKDGWRGNRIKEREVRYVIRRHVPDEAEAERILELVKNQSEY